MANNGTDVDEACYTNLDPNSRMSTEYAVISSGKVELRIKSSDKSGQRMVVRCRYAVIIIIALFISLVAVSSGMIYIMHKEYTDECTDGTQTCENVVCKNNTGGFTCVCQRGWTGDSCNETLSCPTGFTENNNRCYRAYGDRKLNQPDAEMYCRKKTGGHLVQILSSEENKVIERLMKQQTPYQARYFMGGSDVWKEGVWEWLPSREPMVFNDWNDGEPNNQENEDCLEAHLNIDNNIEWNDVPCTDKYNFICERPIDLGDPVD